MARKLLFYFLFHGLHIGIFAFGWYVIQAVAITKGANSGTGTSKRLKYD